MGVPSLYSTIVSSIPGCMKESQENVDHFYLDFNGLIHYCRSKITIPSGASSYVEDEILINEVVRYTVYLTTRVVKPQSLLYISIDGPVPVAKMTKQRARRYKKVQDASFTNKLRTTMGVQTTSPVFDSNRITPGTAFMQKLSTRLRNYANIGVFNSHVHKCKKFTVIIDDTCIPGEGEHKIFKFIKGSKSAGQKRIVYGMDADLIMLSMQFENICLMREHEENDAVAYKYMDINIVKRDMIVKVFDIPNKDDIRVLQDFTFFSFLGGNDFVTALPGVQMKENGLEKLYRAYKCGLDAHGYLVNVDHSINMDTLRSMLHFLVKNESNILARRYHNMCNTRASKTDDMTFERAVELYEHSSYYDPKNPFHAYYKNVLHAIDYKDPNWKSQYNGYFFDCPIEEVCRDYLASLVFCQKYYENNEPCSWFFHYKHRNAPPISDLLAFIEDIDALNVAFPPPPDGFDNAPLTPYEQLMAVLPIQSVGILPSSFQHFVVPEDSPMHDAYPKKVKLDVLAGFKNIYSEPILPPVDFTSIRMVCKNVLLYEAETRRNQLRDRPFRKVFGKQD